MRANENMPDAGFTHARAHNEAMEYLVNAKTPDEKAAAAGMLIKLANTGFGPAQYSAHLCYEGGYGVEQDAGKALDFLESAAESGHFESQVKMTDIWSYFIPMHEMYDGSQAKIVEQAKMRDPEALFLLGMCKCYGVDTVCDPDQARSLLEESAELGNEHAALALRFQEYLDDPASKPISAALPLLIDAANLGNTAAIYFVMRLPMRGMDWRTFLDEGEVRRVLEKELQFGSSYAVRVSRLLGD